MTFLIDIYTSFVELGPEPTILLLLGAVTLFFLLRELVRWLREQRKAIQTISEISEAMTNDETQRIVKTSIVVKDLEEIKNRLECLCEKIEQSCKDCHLEKDIQALHEDNRETNQILKETDNDIKDISKEIQRTCLELLSLSKVLVQNGRN